MKTILEIVSMIQDGKVRTGNVVQINRDDAMSVNDSFSNSEHVLNVHIGFNTVGTDESALINQVFDAVKYSTELKQRYFPQ